ncbi:MAG: hypothetical protein AABY22_01955 [Nanoarchaeota archaeon]
MNYELAKKLKDAGFPFKEHHLGILHMDEYTPANYPSLSELIVACGDNFGGLFRIKLLKGDKLIKIIWRAISLK